MNVRWKNMEIVTMQAGGLLLTRRSETLRRARARKIEGLPPRTKFSGVPITF